jgi:hypothetical protein
MARRDRRLPPRARNAGTWYRTPRSMEHLCVRCNKRHLESPDVQEYRPDLDQDGTQRAQHPHWPTTGWLVWWHCPRCGHDQLVAVTAAQVVSWGHELGGWR